MKVVCLLRRFFCHPVLFCAIRNHKGFLYLIPPPVLAFILFFSLRLGNSVSSHNYGNSLAFICGRVSHTYALPFFLLFFFSPRCEAYTFFFFFLVIFLFFCFCLIYVCFFSDVCPPLEKRWSRWTSTSPCPRSARYSAVTPYEHASASLELWWLPGTSRTPSCRIESTPGKGFRTTLRTTSYITLVSEEAKC